MGNTHYKLLIFNTLWSAAKLPFSYPSVFVRSVFLYFLTITTINASVPYFIVSGTQIVEFPPVTIVGLAAVAHFAVAWHRFIILGERQPAIVRFGRYEAFYLMLLLIGGPGVSFLAQAIGTLPELVKASGILLMGIVLISFIIPLFGMIAPSVAIGKFTVSIGFYWKLMTNNRLRFLGVLLIAEFILIAAYWVCIKLGGFLTWHVLVPVLNIQAPNPADPDLSVLLAINAPSSVFLGVMHTYLVSVGIGVLSISYYRLAAIR